MDDKEMIHVIIDVETTSKYPDQNKIIQIVLKVMNKEDNFSRYVMTHQRIDKEAEKVHNISMLFLNQVGANFFDVVGKEMIDWISNLQLKYSQKKNLTNFSQWKYIRL